MMDRQHENRTPLSCSSIFAIHQNIIDTVQDHVLLLRQLTKYNIPVADHSMVSTCIGMSGKALAAGKKVNVSRAKTGG